VKVCTSIRVHIVLFFCEFLANTDAYIDLLQVNNLTLAELINSTDTIWRCQIFFFFFPDYPNGRYK
jgi:hypothetical protein